MLNFSYLLLLSIVFPSRIQNKTSSLINYYFFIIATRYIFYVSGDYLKIIGKPGEKKTQRMSIDCRPIFFFGNMMIENLLYRGKDLIVNQLD